MERISKTVQAGLTLLAFAATLAQAGTVLAPVKKEAPLKPGEAYPESRFGMPPMNPETGISSGYASRAVEEMEDRTDEDGERAASRMPASSGFTRRPAQSQSQKAVGAPSESSSTAPAIAPVVTESAVARKGIQEVALIAGDLGFFPKTFFVTRDVPVRIFVTGASKNTLCIMMDSFGVRKQIRSQKIEEITFTPGNPGKYRYYCPVNGMEGTMIVKELATAVVTPAEQ